VGKLEHRRLGNGDWPLVVIDDFYEAPQSLLGQAGDISNFSSYEHDYYPGIKQAINDEQYANNFERYQAALSDIFGECHTLQETTYAIANTAPDALLPIQRVPHYDTADTSQLALVHYLCGPSCGGTAFYQHRSTALECISSQNERMFQQALGREATTHGLPPAKYASGSTDLFKQVGIVEAKFNRAIVYPASLLHSGVINWAHLSEQDSETPLRHRRLTITARVLKMSSPSV